MYFLSINILCFLFLQIFGTFGRPTHVLQDYDRDTKDNSYRDNDNGETDDYQHTDRKSSLKQFAGNEPAPKPELLIDNVHNSNEADNARPDKDYLENNDDQDAVRLSQEAESMSTDVKRTASYNNGVFLFHDNKNQRTAETNEYNEEHKGRPSQHARYLKQYNTVRTAEREALNRDRRQIKNSFLNEPIGTEISTQKIELTANEDEETAIRRHVKKLSKEELDELLHSLSDDKRTLLKNIIDNYQQEYDSIDKREITKKAGANEENSFVGNEQSDTSKIQGGSANFEAESSMAPNFEKLDNTKKSDPESMYSKSTEPSNSSEKSNDKINVLDSITDKTVVKSESIENLVPSETESKILGNLDAEKDTSKKGNKREIDSKSLVQSDSIIEEPAILRSSNKEDLYCSDSEVLSQLWNEESGLYDDKKYKREVCPDDLNSIKSLEESFPNADSPNDFKPESDMAPLIRVKRNKLDKVVEKRDMNVVSNIKVPYFSSVLENDEEGSDEGSEFQDDGFFDKGAKSGESAKRVIDISNSNEKNSIKYCGNSQLNHMDKVKLETDTVGLGSDTDVVLSGIEGVDDNIMYNSVARIRRTGSALDNLHKEGEADKYKQDTKEQFASQNEDNEISEEYNNAARYQENDAFGSLLRNYEQDLGRYKRIRRLKPEKNLPAAM